MLDELFLTVFNPTMEDIPQTFAPYMREYFRHDPRFQDRLGVSSSSYRPISISVGVVCTQTAVPVLGVPEVSLTVFAVPNVLERLLIELTPPIPRERVVYFEAIEPSIPRELFFMMPNIETLRILDVELSKDFLQPNPGANTKLLPSLRFLSLQGLTLSDNDWGHLTTYLARQTSDGQVISLEIGGSFPHLCLEVMEEVETLVEEFNCHPNPVTTCPLGRCEGEVERSGQPDDPQWPLRRGKKKKK